MKSYLFVIVDTHKDSHTAGVLDYYFNILAIISFYNSKPGFAHLEKSLKNLDAEKILSLALKIARGLRSFLACYLILKGYTVIEINPASTDRGRKHLVSRDKLDNMDSIVIAKTLIRERKSLHPVRIERNSVALREMIGYLQMIVSESTRIKTGFIWHYFTIEDKGFLGHFRIPSFGKCTLAFFLRYSSLSLLKEIDKDTLSIFLKRSSKGRFFSSSKLAKFCSIAPSERSTGRK